MASTRYSAQVTRGDVPRSSTPGVFNTYGSWSVTGAALVANDIIQMVSVPIGARIISFDFYCTDLDGGATPAVTLSIGDGTTAARFVTTSTVGQAGGQIRFPSDSATTDAGIGYQYTVNDTIDVKVITAPQTTATTIVMKMNVLMSIDQPD